MHPAPLPPLQTRTATRGNLVEGLLPSCRASFAAKRRAATGAKILARAKPLGIEERDGQAFTIMQLPPKRRGGRR
jgi:hypothetical protein